VVFGNSDGFNSSLEASSLDGSNGFIVRGDQEFGRFARSIASGDVNGDGIDDIIAGTPHVDLEGDYITQGAAYVLFGKSTSFSSVIEISDLGFSAPGFVLAGQSGRSDNTGYGVASGDINGDSIDDIIVSASYAPDYGMVYVVFGQTDAFPDTLQFETLATSPSASGFSIAGPPGELTYFGQSLGVGDINGDGIDDVLSGAAFFTPTGYYTYESGQATVVFGQTTAFPDTLHTSDLDGSDGFHFFGAFDYERMGTSISSGDINGDNFNDLIVGGKDDSGNYYDGYYAENGRVYVIFGGNSFPGSIDSTDINGNNGFFIQGDRAYNYFGISVSSADIDGDGTDDIIAGAEDVNNYAYAGAVYVIYGFDDTSVSQFELSTLDGSNGFILGEPEVDSYGIQLGSAVTTGDIDGDSRDEIIISAPDRSPSSTNDNGAVYVFFNTMNQVIDGDEGFRMLSAPTHGPVFDELLDPFFTQGFTGADNTSDSFDENVWTWDSGSQAWTALTNQAIDNLDAGQGFLFYIFSDDSADGTPDGFPKQVSASQFGGDGTFNDGTINAVSGLGDGDFFLAGNPFGFTIDWDSSAVSKTNLSGAIYIWDDANAQYQTWNGTTGNITDGKIAPFQGFFIQASGGTGSLSIGEGAISGSPAVFLKQVPAEPKILKIHAEAGDFETNAWLSFQQGGEPGRDNFDALALKSLASSWLRLTTVTDSREELTINALPVDQAEELRIPLLISGLLVDTETAHLSFEGLDDFTGWSIAIHDLDTEQVYELSEPASVHLDIQKVHADGPTLPVPIVTKAKADSHRFELVLTPGTAVNTEPVSDLPTVVELQQNYPNPFNPATSIEYGVPNAGPVTLEVFDIMGRKVATLVKRETMQPGRYQVRFDASQLASGMYLYRLAAGTTVLTKKLTLIK
ncbi:MAG: T9SS type A sorting domain-containing protein, partial [Balneolales bacterium]|nr:T9SS type A sorting domain-containing protein [Balneolales bacterium]